MYPICAQQCVILQMCANTQSDINLNRKLSSPCSVIKRGDISPSPTKVLSHISSAKKYSRKSVCSCTQVPRYELVIYRQLFYSQLRTLTFVPSVAELLQPLDS